MCLCVCLCVCVQDSLLLLLLFFIEYEPVFFYFTFRPKSSTITVVDLLSDNRSIHGPGVERVWPDNLCPGSRRTRYRRGQFSHCGGCSRADDDDVGRHGSNKKEI